MYSIAYSGHAVRCVSCGLLLLLDGRRHTCPLPAIALWGTLDELRESLVSQGCQTTEIRSGRVTSVGPNQLVRSPRTVKTVSLGVRVEIYPASGLHTLPRSDDSRMSRRLIDNRTIFCKHTVLASHRSDGHCVRKDRDECCCTEWIPAGAFFL